MPNPTKHVLAFDIGIRNLAWCFLSEAEADGPAGAAATPTVRGWQNYDLLAGSGTQEAKDAAVQKCSVCSTTNAAFRNPAGVTCLRHCPASHPPLKDLSGVVLRRMPSLPALRAMLPTAPKRATRVQLVELLAASRSLPLEKIKVKKAVETNLVLLHDGIRRFVLAHLELFRQATHILLENQPVLKNPTMKTVQILLFATLRDCIGKPEQIMKLVHAGKKVKGKETGDAGYKSRKDASEGKVMLTLEKGKVAEATKWLTMFKGQSKKSDLADAMCMCLDLLDQAQAQA